MTSKNQQAAPPLKSMAGGIDSEKWELVPCAFCHGKGTDPYNVMSAASRCESCRGRKSVLVVRNHVRCKCCNGAGSDKTYRCPECLGAGVVSVVPEPNAVCPECGGVGFSSSSGLECLKCVGRGLIAAPASTAQTKQRSAS